MVRAIDQSTWRHAMFLERVRPGIAISLVLHALLLLALAYYLAFPPGTKPADEPGLNVITIMDPPHAPPPKPPKTQEIKTFRPIDPPPLNHVPLPDGTLQLPPDIVDRGPVERTENPPGPPVISDAKPVYRGGLNFPDKALDAGQGGYVDFIFTIEPDGSVGDPQVVAEAPSGYGFAAAALKAFTKWRFEPKLVDGKRVAASARYRVSFKLQ